MTAAVDAAQQIRVGEVTLDVTVEGPVGGEPVVLLHGFPETGREWSIVTPSLVRAGYRVLAPNQRGYSPAARPPGVAAYHIDALVGDVVGLIGAFGCASAHLVGHDWGAIVAWCAAARCPERVRTLTAVSVPHPASFAKARRESRDQQRRSSYIDFIRLEGKAERVLLEDGARRLRAMYGGAVPPGLVDQHLAVIARPDAITPVLSWYRATSNADFEAVPAVSVPTTYLWGNQDPAIGREAAEGCARYVKGPFRFVELDGVGHWIPEASPGRVAREILARLGGTA